MGYYTSWGYDCNLSRQLTRDEYVEFVKLTEDMNSWWNIQTVNGVDELRAYEDSFKSYDLEKELDTIVKFFVSCWIELSWQFTWDWEESWDQWKIVFRWRLFSKETPEYNETFLQKACALLRSNWYEDAADFLNKNLQ